MERTRLLAYLNELLMVDQIEDYCKNGLQVEGREEIRRIGLGVTASRRLFEEAVSRNCDAIIVHHGLFWKKDPHPFELTGLQKRRIEVLIKHDINLIAYHLPLDAHPKLGNNIQILKQLQIPPVEAVELGFIGSPRTVLSVHQLQKEIDQRLQTESRLFAFGKEFVEKLLVISGSSSAACERAREIGVDTFLGGDIREEHVRMMEELELNFIAAGHYNTEKYGVIALADHLQSQLGLETEFIDIPNPI